MKKVEISIVIVNYRVEKNLLACVESIKKLFKGVNYEVIVVENDIKTNLSKKLKRFIFVKYIKSKKNVGFGQGNNLGAKYAKGEYLFFLNPDTKIISGSILELLRLFEDPKTCIVAPLLVDKNKRVFKKQGTMRLTPLTGIFSLSFIHKYFPNNPIAKRFWLHNWNKKKTHEVDVVPGTAFIIKRLVFWKMGGFDPHFFLFFEENDLCNRVKKSGYKIYIDPSLRILHEWGKSTKQNKDTEAIFEASRAYYFKKNYGLLGILTDIILNKRKSLIALKHTVTILCISLVALFLRTYELNSLMAFIPDQGWFYLSARDLLLTHVVPLVGPPTSHPWIHHGPLWTYMLAILLYFFKFNPVAPAYFIAVLGVTTVVLLYFVALKMYGGRTALISALLFATSPLIVMNARIPYHTSPIPFFVIILFFLTYLWLKGNFKIFPFITLLLAILYNHEITTFVFDIAIGIIFMFGVIRKKEWVKNIVQSKFIIFASIVFFVIPMTPFILYDVHHGYHQTVGFLVWVGYRIVKFPLSLFDKSFASKGSNPSTIPEFLSNYQELMFVKSGFISTLILIGSIFGFIFITIKNLKTQYILLMFFLVVSFGGLITHRIPIEADLLLISPFFVLIFAVCVNKLMDIRRLKPVISVLFALLIGVNTYMILDTNFFTRIGFYTRTPLYERIQAVNQVIYLSHGESYTIIGKGELSDFPVFLDPYRYLLWYEGFPPSQKKQKLTIQIWEKQNSIEVSRIR